MTSPFFDPGRRTRWGRDRKRLLLVSYHFPPAGAVGGLRWQKFSRHLADEGYDLDVLTLPPEQAEERDPGRLHDLPETIRLYGVPDATSHAHRIEDAIHGLVEPLRQWLDPDGSGDGTDRARGAVRSARFRDRITDGSFSARDVYRTYRTLVRHVEGRRWARRAARVGTRLARKREYRAVVSSGPPHFAHIAARRVSREGDLPLVLDFRDPWSLMTWVPEDIACPAWLKLARAQEEECVEDARLVVVNTDAHREAMAREYPGASDRLVTVLNGYDADDRPARDPGGETGRPGETFRIVYTGSIYGKRDPRSFFRAAGRLVEERRLDPDQLRVEFMGDVDEYGGRSVEALARAAGLGRHFRAHGPRPRPEALEFCSTASVLLSLPQKTELCIPTKIYEYMMFDSWLLALENEGSATAGVLRDTHADVVRPGDVGAIESVLERRFREWRAGRRPDPIGGDRRYSRRFQARRLIDHLEEHTGGTPPDSLALSA